MKANCGQLTLYKCVYLISFVLSFSVKIDKIKI